LVVVVVMVVMVVVVVVSLIKTDFPRSRSLERSWMWG
jgi:hypothetical protein